MSHTLECAFKVTLTPGAKRGKLFAHWKAFDRVCDPRTFFIFHRSLCVGYRSTSNIDIRQEKARVPPVFLKLIACLSLKTDNFPLSCLEWNHFVTYNTQLFRDFSLNKKFYTISELFERNFWVDIFEETMIHYDSYGLVSKKILFTNRKIFCQFSNGWLRLLPKEKKNRITQGIRNVILEVVFLQFYYEPFNAPCPLKHHACLNKPAAETAACFF